MTAYNRERTRKSRARTVNFLALRKDGLTNREIMETANCTYNVVENALSGRQVKRCGLEWVPAPRPSLNRVQTDDFLKCPVCGIDMREAADQCGFCADEAELAA